ncbi:hypothetical protein MKQ68_01965 [Chitinophaga horti]|uniref:Uncharacterized protein n=1 Tax=Chitinophaga horti TaxID=2920382 RepID=A0ABY6J2H7_9BACT|nr:hypothetical protein [Chitinophaga horti]UYQ93860.1 hypothetical protein MKQ68_01965 [Chitinophaga horti]
MSTSKSNRYQRFRLTQRKRQNADATNRLSYYEDNNNNSLLNEAGRDAARNAINENKALGLPVTYFKDGWVVREMPDGDIVKVKQVEEVAVSAEELKAKKGIVINVRR